MSAELIYWDSDAFLGWLQNESGKADLCEGTIKRAEAGEVLIITSALTISEVLWMRGAPRVSRDKAQILQRFFRRSFIRVRNVTRTTSESAQERVWDHGIKPRDAIHVATALEAKASTLETFDNGLIAKTGTVGDPPLVIRKPIAPAQRKLL
jgi:predicted nucleic acid-binding protein